MPVPETLGTWAGIAQAIAAVIAIGLGGIFAWRRGLLFRYGQPHLTISHEVTHRTVSTGYAHIEITSILRNTSRVKVEIRDGLFTVQQIAPMPDYYVEDLYRQAFLARISYRDFQWPVLEDIRLEWEKDELIAEPGETLAITLEYVTPKGVESVLFTTQFYNMKVLGKMGENVAPREAAPRKLLRFWRRSGPKGWFRTTAYDIIDRNAPQ